MTHAWRVDWVPRAEPLTPLVARIPRQELDALLNRELTGDMRGLAVDDALFLFASLENLPWTPNVRYFGRDAEAPTLFLPSHSQPSIPHELFERCLRRRYGFSGPLLVDPQAGRVIGVVADSVITHQALLQFTEGADI
jgi:hypothetical protein